MPQDKRLIITKAVLYKLQRTCSEAKADAAQEGIFLEFNLPSVVVTQCPELVQQHRFHFPHRVFAKDGRTSCLIIPKVIAHDCFKVNKRHGYYDAVVTAEAICKANDAEAAARAVKVANTFSHYVVDARITGKLPRAIVAAVENSGGRKSSSATATAASSPASAAATSSSSAAAVARMAQYPQKSITPLDGLDQRESLGFRLSHGTTVGLIESRRQGQLTIRVGHGGMTAGEICENAKAFIIALKKAYPTVWRYLHDFLLVSSVTERIRFMEVQIQK